MRAADQVVLVTGGGTGIGRATAMLYAKEGARVALMGRRKGPLTRVANAIRRRGGTALALQGSVVDEDSVRTAVERTVDECKGIDVLINNAGLPGVAAPVHDTTDATWQEMIDHNLTGAFRMSRAILPHFVRAASGIIVNVSSIAALVGMRGMAPYSAAKSGLIALTRSIAVEYGRLGIRCNCICPGTVMSPMTKQFLKDAHRYECAKGSNPLMRVGRPEEIAHSIFYLGSSESSFLTGAIVTVDGGRTAW